jgi:hypothetical protein
LGQIDFPAHFRHVPSSIVMSGVVSARYHRRNNIWGCLTNNANGSAEADDEGSRRLPMAFVRTVGASQRRQHGT